MFQQGCTKVPPRFFKFRGVSGSLGQIRFGLPKGSVLKGSVEGSQRFHRGSTEVPLGFTKVTQFRDLSGLLGQVRFGVPKGSVEGSPITSLNLFRSSTRFLQFSSVSFGVFSHSKGLGAK